MREHVANTTLNRCDVVGKQSPIDLQQTEGEDGECTAAHQIRTRVSLSSIYWYQQLDLTHHHYVVDNFFLQRAVPYRLSSEHIRKVIEPNKLRLILPRRRCLDLDDDTCTSLRPPMADFPNWSSSLTHHSDLLNLDIKVPGEHVVQGETFDAEIQMLHLHLEAARMGYIGIPIRAENDAFNKEYQELLDHFQVAYDENMAKCNLGSRQLFNTSDVSDNGLNTTEGFEEESRQRKGSFDPYTDFMKALERPDPENQTPSLLGFISLLLYSYRGWHANSFKQRRKLS